LFLLLILVVKVHYSLYKLTIDLFFQVIPGPWATAAPAVVNLDFHMKTAPGLSWVSNEIQNSVELPTVCRICDHALISSKWPFQFSEMAILKLKKLFSFITTYLVDTIQDFFHCISKMTLTKV
jgi:hypothetical protein